MGKPHGDCTAGQCCQRDAPCVQQENVVPCSPEKNSGDFPLN